MLLNQTVRTSKVSFYTPRAFAFDNKNSMCLDCCVVDLLMLVKRKEKKKKEKRGASGSTLTLIGLYYKLNAKRD